MITQTAMALSSLLASSLLPLLCLLLSVAAAANHQQEQPTPASPPVTLAVAGCPDKCGDVSIPYPFGTKDGCFRPGFFIFCNHTFDPPRPFINSGLDTYTDTVIFVDDPYYLMTNLIFKDVPMETGNNESTWPIELAGVSLSEGKARLLGFFGYECRLNETHHLVRRQVIQFSGNPQFVLSDTDNVLMGIGSDVTAEQSHGPLCQSYVFPSDGPVNGSCDGQGCCHTKVPPQRYNIEVTIRKGIMYKYEDRSD